MDGECFDLMTKTLVGGRTSRRRVLRGLAASALGLALSRLGLAETAAQEAGATAQSGCRKETKDCRRDNQCCSGVCRQKTCRRAPNQGTCTIRKNVCTTGASDGTRCGIASEEDECHCAVTTSGASFCAGLGTCVACTSDADCTAVTGPGSACLRPGDRCCSFGGEGTSCFAPCADPDGSARRGEADGARSAAP